VNLVYCDVFDQIRSFPRLPSAPSVGRAKALRNSIKLAIAHRTTKSFSEWHSPNRSDDVVDLQLKKATIGGNYAARLGMPRGQATVDEHSCSARSSHARLAARLRLE
jgi:hypothetical protein